MATMHPSSDQEKIYQLVREALHKTEARLGQKRRQDTWLLGGSILFGTLATLLAGGAAATGSEATALFGGWQNLCYGVAFITAVGTITTSLHKSFRITEKMGALVACVGKLKSLEISMHLERGDAREWVETYESILKEHPESLV